MYYTKDTQIISFFEKSKERFSKKEILSPSDIEHLFMSSLDLLNTTYPNQVLLKYFLQPDIAQLILYELNNSGLSSIESRNAIQNDLSEIIKKFPRKKSKRFIKFRILDKYGIYPNCDSSREGIQYININQIPTLQTTNYYSSEQQFTNYSEVSWITRKELQAATCILLAPKHGKPLLYFSDYNYTELSEENLEDVPKDLRSYFLLELVQFQNRFKPLNNAYIERETLQDVTAFRFFNFKESISDFHKLVDNFSIRDHLLMRTANFLIKSSMLWGNRTFGEEAVTNIFFAIEGCLHLLQKKHGDSSTKLNRKLLKKVFKENISHGENLYDFIEEGYYKRISLVHAEPDWGAEWSPFIMADDFYEYRNICIELLNFILIDRKSE